MSDAAKPNPTHFGPYLNVTDDGYIWWRLEEAIKLGAGYVPVCDERNPVPFLRAQNNRAQADERTLLGAFHDSRLVIVRPRVLERDEGFFVEARDFLRWLSQYVTQTQAGIPFPNDLARAVEDAAGASVERRPSFESLTAALEGWFERPLAELPDEMRQRAEREFFPTPWDNLSVDQRRSLAHQWDYLHDPATEQERHYWWHFFLRKGEIEKQIALWGAVSANTASELAQKEDRLKELRQEFSGLEQRKRQASGDYYPTRAPSAGPEVSPSPIPAAPVRYIAYPKAMKLLADRLEATPEELAAWVWVGPENGGLAAYLNANEIDPPPRFFYVPCGDGDDFDYLSPLMACWFREDDLARFEPADRYITGQALIERWSRQPGLQPEAFIRAKIAESRLLDAHPIYGGTQGTFSEQPGFPPLASGLFAMSHVEEIEAEDFGVDNVGQSQPRNKGHLNYDPEMQRRANEIAAAKLKETGRPLTRNKVAKLLAAELEMDESTVLRRIRKQW